MRGYTGALDFVSEGVFINGAYNGWCGNCNQMSDLDGDSIYTATLLIPAGAQEFKYTIGGWNDQEALTAGDPCVLTTGVNTNRLIDVNGDVSLDIICWNSCTTCVAAPPASGNAQYCDSIIYHFQNPAEVASAIFLTITNTSATTMDVIIESADADAVDLLIVTNGTGASISAENYPSPGVISRTLTWTAPTPDIDLNILWSKASFGGNWQLTATDITVSFADSCTNSAPPAVDGNIDFSVDMRGYTGALDFVSEGVFINGAYNGWCGNCNQMSDLDGDSIYTATLLIPAGAQEFKYTIGGWNDQEALTAGDPCVLTTGVNTNRLIDVNGDVSLDTICWNSCIACDATPALAQMDLPVTFDDTVTVSYATIDFGGTASSFVTDPAGGLNIVTETIKTNTAEIWGGTTLAEFVAPGGAPHDIGFLNAIPFTAGATTMSVRVYSPDAGIPVRLKVENELDATVTVETEAMTTIANAWETLVFDFANEVTSTAALNFASTYDKASIFFNFGTDGATAGNKTYYWDDVEFGGATTNPCVGVIGDPLILDDFECQGNITYTFENATWTPNIPNPNPTGANTSSMVGEFIHWGAGSDGAFGGSLNLGPISLSTNNQLKIDVHTNATAIPITVVMQDAALNTVVESVMTTSTMGAWETLTFDMSSASTATNIANIVIVVNPGTNVQDTLYIDNVRLDGFAINPCETAVPNKDIMEDFDCQRNIDHLFAEGGFITIANPDMSGINTSNNIGQYTRNNTVADAFGGDFILAPLDFATNNQVKMNIWDANAPSEVTIVLQDASGADVGNAVASSTTANVWEDLNFDFSGTPDAAGVSKVVILFDAGVKADSGQVYFFDNLRMDGFVTGITEINSTVITVYPNPVNDFINVNVSELKDTPSFVISIYSIDGKLIKEFNETNTNNELYLDINEISSGFYLLEVEANNKKHITKFVKK